MSQTARVLKMLKQNKYGVPNYRFPQAGILRYSGRIAELRQEGHSIVAERQIIGGRATGVWLYHLLDDTVEDLKSAPKRRKFLGIL